MDTLTAQRAIDNYRHVAHAHSQYDIPLTHDQRGTQIAEDREGAPQFGKKARRQEDVQESTEPALTGKRAFEHYLLCFQLVLWKQIRWLVSVKNLPSELETVTRDIWALRLQSLQSRVSYESESEAEQSSQLYSSQSEAERTDDTAHKRKARKSKNEAVPRLVDGLSMCYVGILLLRLPVTVGEMHSWAASGDLIYYRAVKALSASMKARLPFTYHQIMDPQSILKPGTLQQAVLDNIVAFDRSFGMVTPPINHILILYRWVHRLALPLEVYSATLRLAGFLDIGFAYDTEVVRSSRFSVLRFAEARLASLLVVATKLIFPLDGEKRYPKTPTELGALGMDWSAWSRARAQYDEAVENGTRLGYQDAMQVTEKDVIDMTGEKLDEYMDWYGSVFAEENVRETGRAGREADFRRAMLRFFPVDRTVNPSSDAMEIDGEERVDPADERLKKVQGALRPVRIKKDDESADSGSISRPGSNYRRFRDVGELSGHAKEFYEEAAKVAGLALKSLVKCVFLMERKLQRWEDAERKKEA